MHDRSLWLRNRNYYYPTCTVRSTYGVVIDITGPEKVFLEPYEVLLQRLVEVVAILRGDQTAIDMPFRDLLLDGPRDE